MTKKMRTMKMILNFLRKWINLKKNIISATKNQMEIN